MSEKNSSNNGQQQQERSNSLLFWGILALLGGVVLILNQLTAMDDWVPWIVLAVGLAMLIWGIVARSVGGLIPGGIVTGVGLGLTLVGENRMDESEAAVGFFLLCLALGFLSIPVTTWLFTDSTHWWGFIPGSIIAVIGLALIVGGTWLESLNLLAFAGPLALVILGGWLLYRFVARKE